MSMRRRRWHKGVVKVNTSSSHTDTQEGTQKCRCVYNEDRRCIMDEQRRWEDAWRTNEDREVR